MLADEKDLAARCRNGSLWHWWRGDGSCRDCGLRQTTFEALTGAPLASAADRRAR